MLDLFRESKESRSELSFDSLSGAFSKHLGRDAMPIIKKFILDGEMIVPASGALGRSITNRMVEIPVFELGFNFDKFAKERVVSGVNPDTAAYAAGLRNGQLREGGVSISLGDTSREVVLTVKDGEEVKSIKYFPVRKDRVQIPLYFKE